MNTTIHSFQYLFAIYVYIWLALTSGVAVSCDFSSCLFIYRTLESSLKEASPDVATLCNFQQDLMECKKKTPKRCRGDLNYHFFENLVRVMLAKDWLSKTCAQYHASSAATRLSVSPGNSIRGNKSRNFTTNSLGDKCASKFSSDAQVSCALFGLTNLKSFSESFNETGTASCSLSGAWSMIDTQEFAIQITNKGGLRPLPKEITTTTLVTVIIKSTTCSERKTYQATFDEVPGMFHDGSLTAGSVFLETVKESEHVKIHIPHLSTTIDITKQVSGNLLIPSLTVAIIMPQVKGNELATDPARLRGLPLCFYGCPKTASVKTRSASNPEKSVSLYCGNLKNSTSYSDDTPSPINAAMCESYGVMKSILPDTTTVNHKLTFPGEDIGITPNEPSESFHAENSALISHSVRLFYGYKSLFLYFSFLVSLICR